MVSLNTEYFPSSLSMLPALSGFLWVNLSFLLVNKSWFKYQRDFWELTCARIFQYPSFSDTASSLSLVYFLGNSPRNSPRKFSFLSHILLSFPYFCHTLRSKKSGPGCFDSLHVRHRLSWNESSNWSFLVLFYNVMLASEEWIYLLLWILSFSCIFW